MGKSKSKRTTIGPVAGNGSTTLDISKDKYVSIQIKATEDSICCVCFCACVVCVTADTITSASHGYETGLKGQVSTTCTLPTGLAACTDYFVIKTSCSAFQLASSRANALSATNINITGAGAGCHTFAPSCSDATSGTINLSYSNCTGPCAIYVADAGIGLFATPGVINACALVSGSARLVDAETGVIPYQSMKVCVCITDYQWNVVVDINTKE